MLREVRMYAVVCDRCGHELHDGDIIAWSDEEQAGAPLGLGGGGRQVVLPRLLHTQRRYRRIAPQITITQKEKRTWKKNLSHRWSLTAVWWRSANSMQKSWL